MATVFPYTFYGVANEALNALNEVEFASIAEFNSAVGFNKFIQMAIVNSQNMIAAYEDVEWPWLNNQTGSQVLTIGQSKYNVSALARKVDWDSFYIDYDVALEDSNARPLKQISFDNYRDNYRVSDLNSVTVDSYSKPDFVVRMQNNTDFIVTPKPSEAYTVRYEYFGFSTELNEHSDVPDVPEQFRDVLLAGVLWQAYKFREDGENSSRAEKEFDDGINRMRRVLIPQSDTMRFVN
jgi:hypothetical protein